MSTATNNSTLATDLATPSFSHISVENKLGAGLLGLLLFVCERFFLSSQYFSMRN